MVACNSIKIKISLLREIDWRVTGHAGAQTARKVERVLSIVI